MPYTPPSHRSPASSAPTSPDASRRSSFHAAPASGSRPSLPRSASYMTRHRRTTSAPLPNRGHVGEPTPEGTSEDLKGMVTSSSVRQSPPPVTDDRIIPSGAMLSPPSSSPESACSDEEDGPEARGRRMENLKALHDAISQIPQHREGSPTKAGPRGRAPPASQPAEFAEGVHHSFSTGSLSDLATGRRRAGHSRSATEPNVFITKHNGNSTTSSEEDSDGDWQTKPQMVRKKSGELVRPALRASSQRRPSSMPGTPTFSKAVHFDSHLEHVRHFLQVDRPLAVSNGSSPADSYGSDSEYPFHSDDRSPPFEWEVTMTNPPAETPIRKAQVVRLERIWLSIDQKSLIGSVAVANLAFQKHVTCRFTLDYWKTTSEVVAEYVGEVRPKETDAGHDRFNFAIKLSDISNLESKTLYFCIRYNVARKELWDNNGGMNFQVDFRKKMLPQNGKKGVIGAASRPVAGLPRSSRRPSPSSSPRPKSVPMGADAFGKSSKLGFNQSIQDYLADSEPTGVRLKGVNSSPSLPSDNLAAGLAAPSGQAFANRYDFGASLTAAVQAAKEATSGKSDGLYMKPHKARTAPVLDTPKAAKKPAAANQPARTATANKNKPATPTSSPATGAPSGASISSSSYEELVNKYCFFGSKPPPQRTANNDSSTNSSNTTVGSPTSRPAAPPSLHSERGTASRSADATPRDLPATASRDGAADRAVSPGAGHSRPSSQVTSRPTSPASLVGGFGPFADPSPNAYQHLQDRFPFSSAETHAATAIRG